MFKKLLVFLLSLLLFLVTLFGLLFLSNKFLFPEPESKSESGVAMKPSDNSFLDFYAEAEKLAQLDFEAEIKNRGEPIGVYHQKGEKIRIDSPDGNFSYLYLAGLKRNYLLDHRKKVAKELFKKEEAPCYFNLYALLEEYYGLKWQKEGKVWEAETRGYVFRASFEGPGGLLSSIEKIEKTTGIKTSELEIVYKKVGSQPDELFYVPDGYRFVSMYERSY